MKDFTLNVLYVDDQQSNLDVVFAMFENIKGVKLSILTSAKKALEFLNKEKIHLLILDILMPEMNGFDLADQLKSDKSTKHIPIIFLTAYFKEEEFINEGYKTGAIDYLTKPINYNHIVQKILQYRELFQKEAEITLQKELLMAQSRRIAMGEMASIIAHQWRQPLSVIAIATESIKVDLGLGKSISETDLCNRMDKISYEVTYLSDVIRDFGHFFHPIADSRIINLSDIIKQSLNIVSLAYNIKNVDVKDEQNVGKHCIKYSNELIQILVSLITNAYEAFPLEQNNRSIELILSGNSESINIDVRDNAGGIDPTIIEKIFDPYFSTKDEKNGVGISLYMVDTIIRSYESASISVKNENAGSCFSMIFKNDWIDKSICK